MRAAVVLLLALFAAPSAAAVPTTLYAHILGMQDFPINTQAPGEDWSIDQTTGTATNTLSCIPKTPLVDVQQDYHTVYGYGSPGLIDYAQLDNGQPRMHPERGLNLDVQLDPALPIVLHWYWSAASAPSAPDTLQEPTPIPNVVVHAVLRTHDAISVNDQAYDSGDVIAEGESAPALLAGPESQGVDHDQVGGRTVYHFAVPLTLKMATIPKATGYNLRVDTFVQSPACSSGRRLMPNTVALHSSPGHRPRIDLGVANPLDLSWGTPIAANGTARLTLYPNSPWGNADVSVAAVTITGPSAATSVQRVATQSVVHEHCCYGRPLAETWAWDYRADHAVPGEYVAHVTLQNLQGATEVRDVAFAVPGEHSLPAVSFAPLVLAISALALALRRKG